MDSYHLKWTICFVQYSVIGYFLYHYLIKHVINLIDQIYCALPIHRLPCHPILGHLPRMVFAFINKSKGLQGTCQTAYEMCMEVINQTNLSIIWIGWYPFYIISGPSGVEAVLNKTNVRKPMIYNMIGIRDGLISAAVDKWRGRRKMIEPFFASKRFHYFSRVIDSETQKLPEQIISWIGKPFDVTNLLYSSAMNIASVVLWGIQRDEHVEMKEKLTEGIEENGLFIVSRFLNPLYWYDATYKYFANGKVHLANIARTQSLTDQAYDICVDSSRKEQQKSIDQGDELDKEVKISDPLLQFFKKNVESGKFKIDTEGIKDELTTMLGAGHETTAVGIRWALFSLGHHPEIQERLYQEIVSIFPDPDEPVDDLERLRNCTFLDQCVKESLRLYPPIPVVLRNLNEEVFIDGRRIPKNSNCVINMVGIHRDPRVYTNPLEYDPDRWSPENASEIPKGSYLPFAVGPRNCIGYRFALTEMKMYLIYIIRHFRFKSVQKPDSFSCLIAITLRPSCTLEIIFTKRE